MIITKKVSSFTLSEIMVVLVISAIVVSLAVTVLNLIQQEIRSIGINYENNTEARIFEQALLYDFNTNTIEFDRKENILICTSSKNIINYRINKNYIVRNSDTIPVRILDYKFYLDNVEVHGGIVDAALLTLSKEFNHRKIFVFKQKSASYYMNFNGV